MTEPAAAPAALSDVGAVIVTHDRAHAALECAGAVSRDVDPTRTVVVVNDPAGAADRDLAELQQSVGDVVFNNRRAGYGANVNAGVARLPRDVRYLLFLNDDAVVERGAIRELCRMLATRPRAGLVGPRFVDADGTPQPSRHKFPTLASELVGALLLPAPVERRVSRRFVEACDADVTEGNAWPVGAALLVRADAFRDVGGFDERYFLYSEETDLAWRMRSRGWTVCFCDDALVRHAGAQSTEGRHQRLLGVSRWLYVRTHWSLPARIALVALLPVVYLWNTVYIAVRVLLSPGSARDKARWWYGRWVKRPLPELHLRAGRPLGTGPR